MVGRRKRGRKKTRSRKGAGEDGVDAQGELLPGADRDHDPGHAETDAAGSPEEGIPEKAGEPPGAPSREDPGERVGESGAAGEADDPPGDPAPDPVAERLAEARSLVVDGRVEEAIERYRRLVAERPDDVRVRNDFGVLHDELGHHERAVEQFEAAREIEPENVEVLANVGAALGHLGRFEAAERELRRAQKLDPEALAPRVALGILYYRRGLYVQAESELRWVCIRDSTHGPAHFYRGEALTRLGQVDEAVEALERATRLQPGNSRAFYLLGILFDRKHMPEEAARMYRRARELARP